MKKILFLFIITLFFTESILAQKNEKPFVIPQIQEWIGGQGTFSIKKGATVVINPDDEKVLMNVCNTFVRDFKEMFLIDLNVRIGFPKKGDIFLSVKPSYLLGEEGYKINIGNNIKICAADKKGVFWATRTILQILEQNNGISLPCGEITDYPKYADRGFMLDCARKFFTIDFLRDYVKFMSYNKMNTFQIHLNDNGFKDFFEGDWNKTYAAFRLESETYPGLAAKDGHYTKKEFIELQKLAEEYCVEIIPEIDVPAHSLAFTKYKPEIGSIEYGMDHLDLFKPETYQFVDALFEEYLSGNEPVFRGPRVHIGTDEYSNKKKDVVEKFRYFTDHYIKHVEKFGKQAVLWGALTHAKGETPVKSENVVMNAWYNGYADPKQMADDGYKLISVPDGLLYIVPAAGYYYDYLNTKHLYNNWEPTTVGKVVFADKHPAILGGMFAVWNDHVGNGISQKDVHHRVLPAMQTLSVKMWSGSRDLIPFDDFQQKRLLISEAPGVNIMGLIKGSKKGEIAYKHNTTLKAGDSCDISEVGYGYKVEFVLNMTSVDKGTVLFENKNAKVYLSDANTGQLSFERDGYINCFDYVVKPNEDVKIGVESDNKVTKLYVNGTLHQTLEIGERLGLADKKTKYYQTLVFPIEKVGNIKGEIKELTITAI